MTTSFAKLSMTDGTTSQLHAGSYAFCPPGLDSFGGTGSVGTDKVLLNAVILPEPNGSWFAGVQIVTSIVPQRPADYC